MFRVSHRGEGLDDADTIEGARGIVRGQPPGRYDVDEITAKSLLSGDTTQRWGVAIKRPDGTVELPSDRPARTGDRPRSSVRAMWHRGR